MSIVFVNYPLETFTPTQSGALATIIYECCRAARRAGEPSPPIVISRSSSVASFDWPGLHCIDYPEPAPSGPLRFLQRAQKKLGHWRHLNQRKWVRQVIDVIRRNHLENLPIVLLNDPETLLSLRRQFPRARLIHWFQNQLESPAAIRTRFGKAADAVMGVSNFTSAWIANYYRIPQERVTTLYNAVDTDHFTPPPPNSLPEENRKPVINFLGRTGIEKGPDLFLRAALRLASSTKNFSLQILGSNHWDRFELDDYQRNLNEMVEAIEKMNIAVRRPGHVSRARLPVELGRAHIHVMSARWDEPFGMATLEAMACGLATVASRTGGTPEVVGNAGLFFERDSEEQLAQHLETLVTNSECRIELGRRARERALEFSWARSWERLAGIAVGSSSSASPTSEKSPQRTPA